MKVRPPVAPRDLFSPAALADPYPLYAELRDASPVQPLGRGRWIACRHADAQALLSDPRCAHWGEDPAALPSHSPHAQALAAAMRLFSPSAPAGGARRTLGAALGRELLQSVAARAQTRADRLLDGLRDGDAFDALAGYAHPLAMVAVGALLGLSQPQEDTLARAMAQWKGSLFDCLRAPGIEALPPGPAAQLQACIEGLVQETSTAAPDGLVARLRDDVKAQDGATPGPDRLLNALLVLIYASHHNLANAIANALLSLARQPAAQKQLRREPALVERAVLELVRHDSPLQYIVLSARESFLLQGCSIREGDEILVAVGSANRDPAVFAHPDTLQFDRPDPHALLSFGSGAWHCMGSGLAVRIGAAGVGRIVARGFALAPGHPSLCWTAIPMAQRGLVALPLVLGAA